MKKPASNERGEQVGGNGGYIIFHGGGAPYDILGVFSKGISLNPVTSCSLLKRAPIGAVQTNSGNSGVCSARFRDRRRYF
jgi:hypothetical protein